MKETIKVAVVRAGYWGPNLARNFRSLAKCKLLSLYDIDQERLNHMKELYPDVETSMDYLDAMNGSGSDAVVIATPARLHYQMAKARLLAGKHTAADASLAQNGKAVLLARKKAIKKVNETSLRKDSIDG